MPYSHSDLPLAGGSPFLQGVIRATPDDFQVAERLSFTPDHAGSHALIQIRKRNANTEWVARKLAAFAGVKRRAIGYAGLKDRHADTVQWFSIDLAGKAEPDWQRLDDREISVVSVTRHGRKLRQGAVRENCFDITVRQISGDKQQLETRLQHIKRVGVPNYFGEQRFGRDNLSRAKAMFCGEINVSDRFKRGIYLSSARALLFNRVLGQRVKDGIWNHVVPGDVMILNGSNSFFSCVAPDETILSRLQSGDIHPSGPLWGEGELPSQSQAAVLERTALAADDLWRNGLENAGLRQKRRSLRVIPGDLTWSACQHDVLRLQFSLPSGSYATSVLREVVSY